MLRVVAVPCAAVCLDPRVVAVMRIIPPAPQASPAGGADAGTHIFPEAGQPAPLPLPVLHAASPGALRSYERVQAVAALALAADRVRGMPQPRRDPGRRRPCCEDPGDTWRAPESRGDCAHVRASRLRTPRRKPSRPHLPPR